MYSLKKLQKRCINGIEKSFELKREICVALMNGEDLEDLIENLREKSEQFTKDQLRYTVIELIEIIRSMSYSQNEYVQMIIERGTKN